MKEIQKQKDGSTKATQGAINITRSVESYVKCYEAIPAELSNGLIEYVNKNAIWDKHVFYNPQSEKEVSISGDKEFEMTLCATGLDRQLGDIVWSCLFQYIDECDPDLFTWRKGFSKPRFHRYGVGTKMAKHCDHISTLFDGRAQGIPILSVVGSLNDDYEGGKFIMWGDTEIEMKAGQITIFPSNFIFPHEVTEVTSGVRHSFVSWAW